MRWFKAAWKHNTIVSGFLAILIWSVICYMSVAQMDIPPLLATAGGAVLAFFLRFKVEDST